MRCSHFLIKHEGSRNPVSRRTNESTSELTRAAADAEMDKWIKQLNEDERPMNEKFAALANHRSDCGSYANGGDLGWFGPGEMQKAFEDATRATEIGSVSPPVNSDSGLHIIFRTG